MNLKLRLDKLPFRITFRGAFPILAFLVSLALVFVVIVPTIQKVGVVQKEKGCSGGAACRGAGAGPAGTTIGSGNADAAYT